uniref:ABC transporter domain-containing protein n=1 Tax=Grammatophora oceanica TaxID=210454 RepID=A0A7S1V0Y6_9STRA|mmetsp:Transcript_3321/g.4532  ORF Transcript_3321/g.4532 Transcript_3321/m.4532 type:complete len:1506 (+) Transcript_3321:257-4774(+)
MEALDEEQPMLGDDAYADPPIDTRPGMGRRRSSRLRSRPRLGSDMSSTSLDQSGNIQYLEAPEEEEDEDRPDHLHRLIQKRKAQVKFVESSMLLQKGSLKAHGHRPSNDSLVSTVSELGTMSLLDDEKSEITSNMKFLTEVEDLMKEMETRFPGEYGSQMIPVQVRVTDLSYKVEVSAQSNKIKTVYNSSFVYDVWSWTKRKLRGAPRPTKAGTKTVLHDVSLTLNPGKMYLVLGPPSSGKTSLLRAIAGRLPPNDKKHNCTGDVRYNGEKVDPKNKLHIENAITFIEQLDFHAPRMTVQETFQFAFKCKDKSHAPPAFHGKMSPEQKEFVQTWDKEQTRVKMIMEALGLSHVADTFVGNADVRGVSGGQRRRVTLGEMIVSVSPVLCGDEISTGLDAASTYDICDILLHLTRLLRMTRVLSLLQPSPETVSLFDEVILLSQGYMIYAGPISQVENYFADLGYRAPDQMDVADFLQVLSTPDGIKLYDSKLDERRQQETTDSEPVEYTPYTMRELAEEFQKSSQYTRIKLSQKKKNASSWRGEDGELIARVRQRFKNNFFQQTFINVKRELLLWRRDTRFLIANAAKNFIMGVSVGGVFFQTKSVISIFGVMFQITLFIMLGAMVAAPANIDGRTIFYKQRDANFYSAFPYVIGKALALMPQAFTDVMIFGTIIYWMVGLAPTFLNYAIFIAILFTFSVVMNQMLTIFAAVARTKTEVQGISSVILLLLVLFCGFIVSPDVIPSYYVWIYWWNPLAWVYRAMLVNEFRSGEYDDLYEEDGVPPEEWLPLGDQILLATGFKLNGEPFGKIWIAYNFAYLVPYFLLCVILTGVGLQFVRRDDSGGGGAADSEDDDQLGMTTEEEMADRKPIHVPFQPVTLSFKDVCYDVKASTGKETIRLLHNVNGVFESGRMCALMGSSGAGKTTLMDVIALRKNSGTVTGDIRLNGFEQEAMTFRRCTGYVEQFDVQAPELTVRETCMFSARLRLDQNEPAVATDEAKLEFVESILETFELTDIADCLVGTDETGGLSFEQRKRLSIAVELAASPSLIFLDEPTSGLDSRAALLVCRALRVIANTGRTVIATIHQPSLAVFQLFDDLLLLKKGGKTVFFGDMGEDCKNLVNYFESTGAANIDKGENPANWMLKVITEEDSAVDYAEAFAGSNKQEALLSRIEDLTINANMSERITFESEFAASRQTRQFRVNDRLRTIYWRSPAYNLGRMLISGGIAFILGSTFLGNRYPAVFAETEMSSLLSTIFISFIIIGVLSITSVLPVMLQIRDAFYRHEASGMLSASSLALALGVAEKYFIVLSGVVFTTVFVGTAGLHFLTIRADIGFWGFFTFNIAIYSYFGQAFMCSVRGTSTAQILASVFIGLNNFFSGLIVRPQYMTGFFQITYWITPGHYVYEGLVMAIFQEDERMVIANDGSEFFEFLISDERSEGPSDLPPCNRQEVDYCEGFVTEYIWVFFGGRFRRENLRTNILVLALYLIAARVFTFVALRKFKYTST